MMMFLLLLLLGFLIYESIGASTMPTPQPPMLHDTSHMTGGLGWSL
jgi:hypothetical protein